jgi:hypothetical protein
VLVPLPERGQKSPASRYQKTALAGRVRSGQAGEIRRETGSRGDRKESAVDTEQLLQMEITILKAENRSLRASLAWTERALHLHGPDTARQTIRRARATSGYGQDKPERCSKPAWPSSRASAFGTAEGPIPEGLSVL